MYTSQCLKKKNFSEQNGFYRQKSVFSVTSLGTKHILNSFWETVLKFSEVIFWYIIPGFLSAFPEFFFRFRLSFISFSVQVIRYCLYNIQVWTLWRPVHDCQCFISCFSLQIWFHCISSVLGIVIMLKNKTIPNQALSRRNGMMN